MILCEHVMLHIHRCRLMPLWEEESVSPRWKRASATLSRQLQRRPAGSPPCLAHLTMHQTHQWPPATPRGVKGATLQLLPVASDGIKAATPRLLLEAVPPGASSGTLPLGAAAATRQQAAGAAPITGKGGSATGGCRSRSAWIQDPPLTFQRYVRLQESWPAGFFSLPSRGAA